MTYDKESQTEKEDFLFLPTDEDEFETPTQHKSAATTPAPLKGGKSTAMLGMMKSFIRENLNSTSQSPGGKKEFTQKTATRKVISQEEFLKITGDRKFSDFLRVKSLFVERALDQTDSCDIIKDYTTQMKGLNKTSKTFNVLNAYEDESLKGRPVMALQWSPLIPELFLVTYGAKVVIPNSGKSSAAVASSAAAASAAQREDTSLGLVCIWSKDLHRRPEFKFLASSPVLTALFHPSEEQLVLGGCYSGQILLWDMKSKSLPVQRSSMSGKGHKHPIYAMSVVNNAVINELVSVSTDGKLCTWDMSRLMEPLTYTFLNYPSPQSSLTSAPSLFSSGGGDPNADDSSNGMGGPLNVCAMTFEQTEAATNIIFGTGSGQIYRSALPYKPNYPPLNQLAAHLGLVTSIQPHPSKAKFHKNLLLTSSLDWTVKLWSLSNLSAPIYEFFTPSYDYVCDAQWSPANPAIFATITSGGTLSLWNLAKSTIEPFDTFTIAKDLEDSASGGKNANAPKNVFLGALNKFVWNNDGSSLLIGDSLGKVHFISMTQSSVATGNDEGKFEMAIANLENRGEFGQFAGTGSGSSGSSSPRRKSTREFEFPLDL